MSSIDPDSEEAQAAARQNDREVFALQMQEKQDEPEQCPYCDGSGSFVVQVSDRQYVTRDMASDAGDLSMEGSLYSDDAWEQQQCQWCAVNAAARGFGKERG